MELTIESSSAVVELDWVVFDQARAAAPERPERIFLEYAPAFQLESGSACGLEAPRELGSRYQEEGSHLRYSE